jgi:hypothetical protein
VIRLALIATAALLALSLGLMHLQHGQTRYFADSARQAQADAETALRIAAYWHAQSQRDRRQLRGCDEIIADINGRAN